MERQQQPHERRSWHYPPAWEGVAWQAAPTPLRDNVALAWRCLAFLAEATAWAAALGALAMTLVTAAVIVGGA